MEQRQGPRLQSCHDAGPGGRRKQGLGQRLSGGAKHTHRTRSLWPEDWETCCSPCGRHDSYPGASDSKGLSPTSGTDPTRLTHFFPEALRGTTQDGCLSKPETAGKARGRRRSREDS